MGDFLAALLARVLASGLPFGRWPELGNLLLHQVVLALALLAANHLLGLYDLRAKRPWE